MAVGLKSRIPPRRLPPSQTSQISRVSQAALSSRGGTSSEAKVTSISKLQPTVTPRRLPTTQVVSSQVKRLPNHRQLPFWLRSLIGAQRSLSILTGTLAIAVLSVYGQTVYSQQLWSQEYRKLENLQRNERQLTAASEVLKNQIAQQAETSRAGLVPSNPDNTIFLQPAPQRPAPAPMPLAPEAAQPAPFSPIGY
jgi:type IV secretory pathway TrbD component